MGIKRVIAGEPITAFWANSLATHIDTISSQGVYNRGVTSSGHEVSFSYNGGFQIQMTPQGDYTIEAGSIFVNGTLIKGTSTGFGNNYSSLQNWDEVMHHKGKNLPKWKIKGYIPTDYTGNISASKFWLINENSEAAEGANMPPEEVPEGMTKWEQLINEVDEAKGLIKQIVTGSIFITLPVAVTSARPFDITVRKKEKAATDEETEGEESESPEEEFVELDINSGSIQFPNNEVVFISQRLKLEKSTAQPFFVVLHTYRDKEGVIKYKYELLNYEEWAAKGYTQIDAQEDA